MDDVKNQLPDGELSSTFCSRAETLLKRLALRGNPISGPFPRPSHPLFPDQAEANKIIAQTLSDEIASARHLAAQADREAKEYRASYQAVKRVQDLLDSAKTSFEGLTSIVQHFENGVESSEGDGSPPDLMAEECLQPAKHSVFLALLPSILERHESHSASAEEALRASRPALLALKSLDVDPSFYDSAALQFQHLSALVQKAHKERESVSGRVSRLRESRRIWTSMEHCLEELSSIRRSLGEAMEQKRWRQQCAVEGAPPTPESPQPTGLPSSSSTNDSGPHSAAQLQSLTQKIVTHVHVPFEPLSRSLEPPLRTKITHGIDSLKDALSQVDKMTALLASIEKQSSVMATVQDDFQGLQIRIEQATLHLESIVARTASGGLDAAAAHSEESDISQDIKTIQANVKAFVDELAQRVPLLARSGKSASDKVIFVPKRFGSVDLRLGVQPPSNSIEVPFDLHQLDDAVRSDCNTYAVRVNGAAQTLERKAVELHLTVLSADANLQMATVDTKLLDADEKLVNLKSVLTNISASPQEDKVSSLASFLAMIVPESQALGAEISSSFPPVRAILSEMDQYHRYHDPTGQPILFLARTKDLKDMEQRFQGWTEGIDLLRASAVNAHQAELALIEQRRLEEEQLRLAEEARLAAEAAEQERLETERLEEEARQQAEEARLEAERKALEEEARAAAEAAELVRLEQERAAEQARLEQERLEAEARDQLEAQKQAEEARRQVEEQRLERERLERERLAKEREEIEEKLRVAEENLVEERRLQLESDRKAAEETQRIVSENQRLKDEEIQRLREAEERRIRVEKERAHKRVKSKDMLTPLPSPGIGLLEEGKRALFPTLIKLTPLLRCLWHGRFCIYS